MKILFTILIALGFTLSLKAQFKLDLSGGYNIGVNKSYSGYLVDGNKASAIFKSFGQGFRFSFKTYYQIDSNFIFGVGANYSISPNFITNTRGAIGLNYIYTEKQQSKLFDLTPFIGYQFKNGIYTHLGMILSMWQLTEIEETNVNMSQGNNSLGEENGRFSTGTELGFGYEYKLSKTISIYGELQLRLLSIKPDKGKFTSLYSNGNPVDMNNINTYHKEWVYADQIDYPVTEPNVNEPEQRSYQNKIISHSSFGLLFGLRFSF